MSPSQLLITVGPFASVPTRCAAGAARRVSERSNASFLAAEGQAMKVGDTTHSSDAFFPGRASINARWADVRSHTKDALTIAGMGLFGMLFSVLGVLTVLASYFSKTDPTRNDAYLVFGAVSGALLILLMSYSSAIFRTFHDYLRKGYIGSSLENAMGYASALCWLFGQKALHVATSPEDGKEKSWSIFYAGIGYASVDIEHGIEYAVVYGLDGGEVARLPVDNHGEGKSALSLVARLNSLASATRA